MKNHGHYMGLGWVRHGLTWGDPGGKNFAEGSITAASKNGRFAEPPGKAKPGVSRGRKATDLNEVAGLP